MILYKTWYWPSDISICTDCLNLFSSFILHMMQPLNKVWINIIKNNTGTNSILHFNCIHCWCMTFHLYLQLCWNRSKLFMLLHVIYIFKACTNIRYDKNFDSHVLCLMQSETVLILKVLLICLVSSFKISISCFITVSFQPCNICESVVQ